MDFNKKTIGVLSRVREAWTDIRRLEESLLISNWPKLYLEPIGKGL